MDIVTITLYEGRTKRSNTILAKTTILCIKKYKKHKLYLFPESKIPDMVVYGPVYINKLIYETVLFGLPIKVPCNECIPTFVEKEASYTVCWNKKRSIALICGY